MSSYILVEIQTFTSDRLFGIPSERRVIRTRISTVTRQMELMPPTSQKIQPTEPLWEAELRTLKMSAAMLERYPSLIEFLIATVSDNVMSYPGCSSPILIPASAKSAEILLALIHNEQRCTGWSVMPLTPAVVSMITGCYFTEKSSQNQMCTYLNQINNEADLVDLMDDATEIDYLDFADPSVANRYLPVVKQVSEQEQDNIERCFQLLNVLQQSYKEQLLGCMTQLAKIFQVQVEKYKPEIIRLESDHFITFTELEKIGLTYKQDVLDLRHAMPNLTFVKLYSSKTHPGEKLSQCIEAFTTQKIKLVAKPLFVDEFPNNPSVLAVMNVPKERLTSLPVWISAIRKAQNQPPIQHLQQLQDVLTVARKQACRHVIVDESESFEIVSNDNLLDVYYICQMDRDLSKKVQLNLGQEFDTLQWALLCYEQFCQIREASAILPDIVEQVFPSIGQQQYSVQQSTQINSLQARDQDVMSKQQIDSQFNAQSQGGAQWAPQVYVPPPIMKSSVTCIRVFGFPHGIKLKEIVNFVKVTRVTERLAWQLHQPFSAGSGPIKILDDYVLFMYQSRVDAERAVITLQNSPFRGMRLDARISDDPSDVRFVEQCFQLRERAPFYPCHCLLLKAVTLPQEREHFLTLVAEWSKEQPDGGIVNNDIGIVFFKDIQAASRAFVAVKLRVFQDHPNDITLQSYDAP